VPVNPTRTLPLGGMFGIAFAYAVGYNDGKAVLFANRVAADNRMMRFGIKAAAVCTLMGGIVVMEVVAKKKIILLIAFAIILFCAVAMIMNPLFMRTTGQIERRLLQITPIGTTWDDALLVIRENENWRLAYTNTNFGFIPYNNRDFHLPPSERRVGEKFVTVDIGQSSWLLDVRVRWVFDSDGYLIGIFAIRLLGIK